MKKTLITIVTLLVIAGVVGGVVYSLKRAQEIPQDLTNWKVIDTTLESNNAIFVTEKLPNPNLVLSVPPEYKWSFEAAKISFPCVNPQTGAQQGCLETTSLTLELRQKIEGEVKKYYPGYDVVISKATTTLDEIIVEIDKQLAGEEIRSKGKTTINGIPAYEVVYERTQAEPQRKYMYYLVNNGAKIEVSTYKKPIPDFLKTLSFE